MNNQISRITSFIDSLDADNVLGDEASFMLSTDLNAIGGNNGKDCVNSTLDSCEDVKNGGNCVNYSNTCGNSDNKGNCINTDLEKPDPKPLNPYIPCN